jgi:hypothetical protein
MTLRRRFWFVVFLMGSTPTLSAHDPSAPPVVEITVRSDPQRVAISMHFPAAALVDANLPRGADGLLVRDGLEAPLGIVARGLSQALDVQVGETALSSPEIRVATGADGESADVHLSYSVRAAEGPLSVRLQQFRAGGERIRTIVRYEPARHGARTFDLSGDYGRVVLEPTPGRVIQEFAARALDTLLAAGTYLLVACAFIAPLRTPRSLASALAAFVAGQSVSMAVVGLQLWAPSDAAFAFSQVFTASTIVVLAALGLLAPTSRWLPALAVLSGASFGIDLGHQFSNVAAFAGSHAAEAWLVFAVILGIGQTCILALFSAVAGLLYRWRVPERWGTVTLVVVVTHAALHRISGSLQPLVDAGIHVDRLLILVTAGWAAATLCAGIVDMVVGRRDTTSWVDADNAGLR